MTDELIHYECPECGWDIFHTAFDNIDRELLSCENCDYSQIAEVFEK